MILIRTPEFRTCYQGLSFPKHLEFARQAGLEASVFESFRAGCDIDCPEDLAEVLLHGRGERRECFWRRWGFPFPKRKRRRHWKDQFVCIRFMNNQSIFDCTPCFSLTIPATAKHKKPISSSLTPTALYLFLTNRKSSKIKYR